MTQATELIAKQMAAGANIGKIWGDLIYNVKAYGAKGDGVTDDTEFVQAAINAAYAAGGGIVYGPPGTYIASRLIMKENVIFRGSGKIITTIKMKSGSNNDFIPLDSPNIGIFDLTLDGNKAGNIGGAGIIVATNDIEIEKVEIKNFPAFGIYGVSGARSTIEKCYIHDNDNVGVLLGAAGNTISEVTIYDCNVTLNKSHGILIGNGATAIASRVIVDANTLIGNGSNDGGGGGVWVTTGGSNVTISDNIAFGNDGDNIAVAGGAYVNISGNQTSNADGPAWDKANSGIAISGASTHVILDGNECFNNTAAGIMIRGTSNNITATDNICWNNSQTLAGDFHGIQVDTISPDTDSGNNIILTGNRCFDDQAIKTQGYGIKIDANADFVVCRNNILNGNLTGPLLNLASGVKSVFIEGNIGYNPVGNVAPPALVHGAGVANNFAFPVRIFLSGGTVAAVYVNGTLTGATGGQILLQPNETIQVNFSGTPSWVWMGM